MSDATSKTPHVVDDARHEMQIEDLKWLTETLGKRAEQSDLLAVGLLTASVALAGLMANALKEQDLGAVAVFLTVCSGLSLLVAALYAVMARSWRVVGGRRFEALRGHTEYPITAEDGSVYVSMHPPTGVCVSPSIARNRRSFGSNEPRTNIPSLFKRRILCSARSGTC